MGKERIEEALNFCNKAIRVNDMSHEELVNMCNALSLANDPAMDSAWKAGYTRGIVEIIKKTLLEELNDDSNK